MQNAITLIAEEPHFLALAKPAGVSVHGGPSVRGETVADWLCQHYPEVRGVGDAPDIRPGIVHRLDKDTSGVLLAARDQETFLLLKQLFKSRSVSKTYLTLVVGVPKEKRGTVEAPIGRLIRAPLKRGVGKGIRNERPAVTQWKLLERFDGFALLEVAPETGRMHQIRVHLASIGHPVAGDKTYGAGNPMPPGLTRQFLHASSLAFSFPEGRRWHFEAALPEELQNTLKELRQLRNSKHRATITRL